MALDGAFLRHIKRELEEKLLGARVDKIHQPNREELVVAFRSRESACRVLFSARANSARVHLTEIPLENPKQPPMLCMLLRKKLQGAKLQAIRQPELERLLHFDFDAVNELGDHVTLTLTMEIMGKYSNIILSDGEGKIIDALKRVDAEMSSQRLVLPGLSYRLPPPQDKLCLLARTAQEAVSAMEALPRDMELSKGLLAVLQGVSPIVCREVAHQVGRGRELTVKTLGEEQRFRLRFFLQQLKETVEGCKEKAHGLFLFGHPPIWRCGSGEGRRELFRAAGRLLPGEGSAGAHAGAGAGLAAAALKPCRAPFPENRGAKGRAGSVRPAGLFAGGG